MYNCFCQCGTISTRNCSLNTFYLNKQIYIINSQFLCHDRIRGLFITSTKCIVFKTSSVKECRIYLSLFPSEPFSSVKSPQDSVFNWKPLNQSRYWKKASMQVQSLQIKKQTYYTSSDLIKIQMFKAIESEFSIESKVWLKYYNHYYYTIQF